MSSLAIGPPFTIDGPSPVTPQYDLLAAAQILPPSTDPHWMIGDDVRAFSTDLPELWSPCQEGSTADIMDTGGPTLIPRFGPFVAYLPATCSTFDSRPDDEFRRRLMAAFEAKEGYAVAKQLASGDGNPLNPFLGDDQADILGGGVPVGYIEALSLLEQAIGATAAGGMIHADPATATAWASYALIRPDGVGSSAVLRTILGTPVAAAGGYTGVQPQGEAAPGATTGWAFASGPVAIRRDTAEIVAGSLKESLDRHVNEVTERAQRNYLVVWDTALQAAVLVNRAVTN